MLRRPLKILFSILILCTFLAGMMIVSPAQFVQAEDIILYAQTPSAATDASVNAYTSTAVPFGENITYEAADNFGGASDYLINHVKWYGVAAKWPNWENGDPTGMKFQITFYQRNPSTLAFTQVAQFSDLSPTFQTYDGVYPFGIYENVQAYCFDTVLPGEVALTAGWVSIRNTVSGNDGSTFLWINSPQGNDECISFGEFLGGEWDHAYFQDDLAFTLTGSTPRYYSVNFQAGANGSLTGATTYADIRAGTAWATAVPALPTPVPAFGYVFDSWSPSFPATVNADLTFTANFVKDQDPNHWFTVSFREGSHGYVFGTRDFYDILTGTPWASAVEVPVPYGDPGYKFDSWSPAFPANVTASATYTASFVIDPTQTFKVTYDGSGSISGTVPVDSNTYHSGDTVTVLSTDKLQAVDDYLNVYTCNGWMTNVEGKQLLWKPGSTFVAAADTTLYAGWVSATQNTATLSGTKSIRSGQKATITFAVSTPGSIKSIPAGNVYFYSSTDPFSTNWNQLGGPATLAHGKTSLTISSLTSPGTYYLYGWFIPTDWEADDDFISNVWTVTVK